nr:transposase [Epibacterium ulvae]
MNKAVERVRLDWPVSIYTDKSSAYRKVIRGIINRYDPHFDYITHIDKKYRNNRVKSNHDAVKILLGYRQSFRTLRSAKATLQGMETIRTTKSGHIQNRQHGVRGEVAFASQLFGLAA